jgi:hypothetical protein
MSKEAREELEERKEKIKQMELVLDMTHAKENDKRKVFREFLSNMVDPLFPFQNQPLENASKQRVKVDISQLKQEGMNWTYRNVVEERAVEIQSLMFMATSIVQRPSIYVLPVENDPDKPSFVRVLQEKPDKDDIDKLASSEFWIIGRQHSVQACRQLLKAHSDREITLNKREVKYLKSHEITVVWSLD